MWETHPATLSINAGEVDSGNEVDNGWLIWVGVATVYFKTVDTVLVIALRFDYRSARRSRTGEEAEAICWLT